MKSTPRGVVFFLSAVVCALILIGLIGSERGVREPAPTVEPSALEDEAPAVFELVDGEWRLPAHGLRLQLPDGWTPVERFGRPYAYRDPQQPLAGSLNVLSLPNLRGLDFEALREENRATLERSPDLDLIAIEEVDVSGVRALRIDYTGRPRDREEVRCAGVVMLLDGKQLVVTAVARPAAWEELAEGIDRSLASVARYEVDARTP